MLTARRVLIVADETLLALSIEDYLVSAGAVIVGPAAYVHQAISIVNEEMVSGGIDAAILDVNLNGELVWPVAELLTQCRVPFLFHTAYQELVVSFGNPLYHKPCSFDLLVEAVHGLCNESIANMPATR